MFDLRRTIGKFLDIKLVSLPDSCKEASDSSSETQDSNQTGANRVRKDPSRKPDSVTHSHRGGYTGPARYYPLFLGWLVVKQSILLLLLYKLAAVANSSDALTELLKVFR